MLVRWTTLIIIHNLIWQHFPFHESVACVERSHYMVDKESQIKILRNYIMITNQYFIIPVREV